MDWEPSEAMRKEAYVRHLRREISRIKRENDRTRKLRQLKLRTELELARKTRRSTARPCWPTRPPWPTR